MNMESSEETLRKLSLEAEQCRRCPLWTTRRRVVFGEGPVNSVAMMIGEAPGREEDLTGRPFVGKSGRLLTEMMESAGISRSEVYITSLLKCRPPNNRNPMASEIKMCAYFLDEQLRVINPSIILPLGKFASENMFLKFGLSLMPISRAHGKPFEISGGKVIIPLYHPAVVAYNPNMRGVLEKDLLFVSKIIKDKKAGL